MPKHIRLEPHLSAKELEHRYRRAKDSVSRSQFQILWLLSLGQTSRQVQQVTGYSLDWIQKLVRRYNQGGPEVMGDRRRLHPGPPPLLSDALQVQLAEALNGPAPDGGAWNSRKVAEWMASKLGRPVSIQRGWEYLRALKQPPRPRLQESQPLVTRRRSEKA